METELQQAQGSLQEAKRAHQALTAAAADSALQAQKARDCQSQGEEQLQAMRLQVEVLVPSIPLFESCPCRSA